MAPTNVSECGRFVVLDGLYLDRNVFDALVTWAEGRGLRIQDAIQLALCSFNERNAGRHCIEPSSKTAYRVRDSRSPAHIRRAV